MNTITNNTFGISGILLAVFVLVLFAFAPVANAADLDYGYGTYYPSGGEDYGYGTYYGGGEDYGYGTYYPSGGEDYGYGTYYPESSFGGWSPSSFGGGGFGGGGFGGGGFFTPTVGGGGNFNAPTSNLVTNNGNTYTYAPTNTNICTGGNVCNTNSNYYDNSIFNAPTTINSPVTVSNPAPIIYNPVQTPPPVYQQPPVYTPPPAYPQPPVYQQPPIYPQPPVYHPTPTYRAPYVSLSAVPYTGLELGPLGTALYWGFLVLWCLAAAYLIAVKKVQNKLVAGLNSFLFPTPAGHVPAHAVHTAAPLGHGRTGEAKATARAAAPAKASESGIDSFIQSQINRSR